MSRLVPQGAWLIVLSAAAPLSAGLTPQVLVQRGEPITWSGPQSIGADSEGRVYFLNGDSRTLYPLSRDHQLGSPVRLEAHSDESYRSGSMGRRGEWLLISGSTIQRSTAESSSTAPALPWLPLSAAFVDGDPLVVLSTSKLKRTGATGDGPAPLVVRWSGDEWVTEIPGVAPSEADAADPTRAISQRAASILEERNGRYFLARLYEYHVEHRRRGKDRPLATLRVGRPGMRERASRPGEEAALSERVKPSERGRVGVFLGLEAVLRMALMPSGQLLLLTGEALGGCGLDRVDWDRRVVDRVGLDSTCPRNMAAGRDGLYLIDGKGDGPRLFLSWKALDEANWSRVKDAEFAD